MFLKDDVLIELLDNISKNNSVAGALSAVDDLIKNLSEDFHEVSANANTETGAIIARIIADAIRQATTAVMTSARLSYKRDKN